VCGHYELICQAIAVRYKEVIQSILTLLRIYLTKSALAVTELERLSISRAEYDATYAYKLINLLESHLLMERK
jgi:hypothetical protein